MKRLALLVLLLSCCSPGYCISAGDATAPANLSPRGVAEWAINGGWISSGTGTLPAVGPVGSWYIALDNATAPVSYRSDGESWVAISSTGSGGGVATDSSASLTAHIADWDDPHGATETITVGLTLGSGTADASIERTATGTLMISSYTVIAPEAATPSATIATGTLWYDSNTNRLRCYDGSGWRNMTYLYWQDLRMPLSTTKINATGTPPTFDNFRGLAVGAYQFSGSINNECFFETQIPHGIYGSTIDAHVHYSTEVDVGAATITMGLEYVITGTNGVIATTTTTIEASVSNVASGTHHILDIGDITLPTSGKDSAMVSARFFRLGAGTDSFTGVVNVFEVDFHYLATRPGSSAEYGDQ